MTKKTRPWLLPALIAAFLFIAGVACNLVAAYIQKDLEPYRHWVYVVFALGMIAAAIAAVVAVRSSQEPSKHKAEPEPPPTSLHQLPKPPKDFTGRKDELDDLLEKVNQGSIAISGLQGTGGVGKTALALVLAERLTPSYPDAQIYLDLKGVSKQPVTPSDAMIRIIHAWNPTANPPEEELEGLYRSVLNGKRALLLLDNAADDKQVLPLLPPDGCLVLVTSRQHFDLPGCYTLSLEMLTPEDSRKLVLEIAPRIGNQADDLAKLCGYLPLALRNAAGALNTRLDLSVSDYMERLSDATERLDLINASLSTSYDLLSVEQQERWRMLSVFPGSFDVEAAAAVWKLELKQAKDLLGELYLRSMVESEMEGRYKLHDLSRVYANDKLGKTERAVTQRRHAEHYAKVAHTANELYKKGGESVLAGLGLFDLERSSIEAGQRWASQHEQDDGFAAELCVGYALGCSYVLALRLHMQEMIEWQNMALRAARRLGNRQTEAYALGSLGNTYFFLGDYRRAIEFHEQSLAIACENGDRPVEANSRSGLGVAYMNLGDYRRAIEFCEQSLAITREISDRPVEAYVLGNLGIAYFSLGDYCRGIEFQEQSLAIARGIGYRRGEGTALGNLGTAYLSLGDYCQGIEFSEQSLAVRREIGDRRGEASALFNMSFALDQLGERVQAIASAQAALDICEQIGAPDADKVRQRLAEWQA